MNGFGFSKDTTGHTSSTARGARNTWSLCLGSIIVVTLLGSTSPARGQSADEIENAGGEASGFSSMPAALRPNPAPPTPPLPPQYRGSGDALDAAREIRRRVAWFLNRRATIQRATWRVSPASVWRVRTAEECHAELREQGIRFVPYEPDEDDEDAIDTFPAPAPIILRSKVGGVRFSSATGQALMSCELATKLPTIARIVSRHGVTRVALSSLYRPEPLASFHTFGLGADIHRMQVEEPLTGGDGRESRWLSVRTDFVETPDVETCDPANFGEGSPYGDNERGRILHQIACELHETGELSTVLTPNYNEGHRGHFHIDVRPDDPRTYIR